MDYALLARQMRALLEGTGDETASLANASALLNEALGGINWVGFYVARNGELLLGPFQGKPACVRIPFGAGVCGTAFEANETVRVEDVHEFPGHIACDSASNSEIVIPLRGASGEPVAGSRRLPRRLRRRFSPVDNSCRHGYNGTKKRL